jgi:hypothetical protein
LGSSSEDANVHVYWFYDPNFRPGNNWNVLLDGEAVPNCSGVFDLLPGIAQSAECDLFVDSGERTISLNLCRDESCVTRSEVVKIPNAPQSFSVVPRDGEFDLLWGSVLGANLYQVDRKNSDGSWESIRNTSSLTVVDHSPGSNGLYEYRVRARNGEFYGPWKYSTGEVQSEIIADSISLLFPINDEAATLNSLNEICFSWSSDEEYERFSLQVSPAFTFERIVWEMSDISLNEVCWDGVNFSSIGSQEIPPPNRLGDGEKFYWRIIAKTLGGQELIGDEQVYSQKGSFVVPGEFSNEEVIYMHSDLLGTPVVRTSSDGEVIGRDNYKPYGERME